MKRVLPLIILYVLLQSNGQTGKLIYEGMDQQSVDNLLKTIVSERPGASYQFVDKKTFDNTPNPVSAAPVADPVKQQAVIDAKNASKSPQDRLDALIKALDLK